MENPAVEWKVFSFDELSIHQLYEILYLRAKIFVVEQNSVYLDPDNKDQKALHVCGYQDGKLVAYSRLFKQGAYFDEASIGRVIVDEAFRRYGYGKILMAKSIELMDSLLSEQVIVISGQLYLQRFYEGFGFQVISETYMEDGIPHVRMKYTKAKR